MADKMGITLTLAELKQYFKIWHENHFNDLHKSQIMDFIDSYLDKEGLLSTISDISDLQKSIVKIIKYMIKIIDGDNSLSDSSSVSSAINKLNEKGNINFDSINLSSLNSRTTSNSNSINQLSNNKVDKDYLDGELNKINNSLGIVPKQLQVQDIPVDNNLNLNNYTKPGLYKSKSSAITQQLLNRPPSNSSSQINDAFSLAIIPHVDSGVRQILLTSEKNNNGNKIYTRNYNNGWSNWYELYGEHNLTTLQMEVEWEGENAGSTVYTLLKK